MTIKSGEKPKSADVLNMAGRILKNQAALILGKTTYGTLISGKLQTVGDTYAGGDVLSSPVFSAITIDEFAAGTVDTDLWTVTGGGVSETGGKLIIQATSSVVLDGVNAPDFRNGNVKSAFWLIQAGSTYGVTPSSELRLVDESGHSVILLSNWANKTDTNKMLVVGIDPVNNLAGGREITYTADHSPTYTGLDISSLVDTDAWHFEIAIGGDTEARITSVRWLDGTPTDVEFISDDYAEPDGVTIVDAIVVINELIGAGTSRVVEVSADGGSTYDIVTESVHSGQYLVKQFTSPGTTLKIRVTMTSTVTTNAVYELIDFVVFYNLSTGV